MKKTILSKFAALATAFLVAVTSFAVPAVAQQVLSNPVVMDHFGSAPRANGGKPPVLSTCGTGPTIGAGSNDQAGRLVTGSALTTCTITFDRAYSRAPVCVVSAEVATQPTYTVTTAAIIISVSIASTPYHYMCRGI